MWLPQVEDFPGSKPTIKLKLAAVRMLYDFLVVRQITPSNSAHSVRGAKYVVKKGKTPVWSREDAKTLLDSIPKDSVSGLRDLALIAAMFYSFARVSAVLKLKVRRCELGDPCPLSASATWTVVNGVRNPAYLVGSRMVCDSVIIKLRMLYDRGLIISHSSLCKLRMMGYFSPLPR